MINNDESPHANLLGWWCVLKCLGRPFHVGQVELYFFSADGWLFIHGPEQPIQLRMQRLPFQYKQESLIIRNGPVQSSGIEMQVVPSNEGVCLVHSDGAQVFLRRLTKSESRAQDAELLRWEWSDVAIFGRLRSNEVKLSEPPEPTKAR
jgi:hypothetical protein